MSSSTSRRMNPSMRKTFNPSNRSTTPIDSSSTRPSVLRNNKKNSSGFRVSKNNASTISTDLIHKYRPDYSPRTDDENQSQVTFCSNVTSTTKNSYTYGSNGNTVGSDSRRNRSSRSNLIDSKSASSRPACHSSDVVVDALTATTTTSPRLKNSGPSQVSTPKTVTSSTTRATRMSIISSYRQQQQQQQQQGSSASVTSDNRSKSNRSLVTSQTKLRQTTSANRSKSNRSLVTSQTKLRQTTPGSRKSLTYLDNRVASYKDNNNIAKTAHRTQNSSIPKTTARGYKNNDDEQSQGSIDSHSTNRTSNTRRSAVSNRSAYSTKPNLESLKRNKHKPISSTMNDNTIMLVDDENYSLISFGSHATTKSRRSSCFDDALINSRQLSKTSNKDMLVRNVSTPLYSISDNDIIDRHHQNDNNQNSTNTTHTIQNDNSKDDDDDSSCASSDGSSQAAVLNVYRKKNDTKDKKSTSQECCDIPTSISQKEKRRSIRIPIDASDDKSQYSFISNITNRSNRQLISSVCNDDRKDDNDDDDQTQASFFSNATHSIRRRLSMSRPHYNKDLQQPLQQDEETQYQQQMDDDDQSQVTSMSARTTNTRGSVRSTISHRLGTVSGAVSTAASAITGFFKTNNPEKQEATLQDVAEHIIKTPHLWIQFQQELSRQGVVTTNAAHVVLQNFAKEKLNGEILQNGLTLDYEILQANCCKRYKDSEKTLKSPYLVEDQTEFILNAVSLKRSPSCTNYNTDTTTNGIGTTKTARDQTRRNSWFAAYNDTSAPNISQRSYVISEFHTNLQHEEEKTHQERRSSITSLHACDDIFIPDNSGDSGGYNNLLRRKVY